MVGAGGIGCELLKTLALTGFKHIHLVSSAAAFCLCIEAFLDMNERSRVFVLGSKHSCNIPAALSPIYCFSFPINNFCM
jgi:hypothetical protein